MKYDSLLKGRDSQSCIAMVFDDGKTRDSTYVYLFTETCNEAVLKNTYDCHRFGLILNLSKFNDADFALKITEKWVAMLQKINPNIVLHSKENSILESLNGVGGTSDHYDDLYELMYGEDNWNFRYYFGTSEGDATYHLNAKNKYVVIEFPADDLAGVTLTLLRYLNRHPYTLIPQFAIDLHEQAKLSVPASILYGHYITPMGVSLKASNAARDYFINYEPLHSYDGPRNHVISDYLLQDFPDDDERCNDIYDNYYGLLLPHLVEYTKVMRMANEDFRSLWRTSLDSPINGIVLHSKKFYNFGVGTYWWNALDDISHNHCIDHCWLTERLRSYRANKALPNGKPFKEIERCWNDLATKVLEPAYEAHVASKGSIPEFLSFVEKKSKQIYG